MNTTHTWGKPHFHFQNGKWHILFKTKYEWSWYIGNGNTLQEAWETFVQARAIGNMMLHTMRER